MLLRQLLVTCVVLLGFCVQARSQEVQVLNMNDPNGNRDFPKIDKSYYKLVGKIKKLTIKEVNGRSTVDCSELDAEEIEIGLIDGESKVILKASKSITFTDRIDGKSNVTATAGENVTINQRLDGVSTLSVRCGGTFEVRDKFDGNSAATIICNDFKARYLGDCSVDLDAKGDVSINERNNNAKIERKNLR